MMELCRFKPNFFLKNLFAIFLTDSKFAPTSAFGTHVEVFWKKLLVSYKHILQIWAKRTPNSHFWVLPMKKLIVKIVARSILLQVCSILNNK